MPNTNPTIVSASLSDKELQDSINNMVANFDKGLQTMLEHSNKYVGKIQESLQKIGDTNFGTKGSNDGAVVKQTKAQNDFADAVKKSTDEIKRQGKETAMSFDQIASAQQKAVQSQSMSRNSIENINNLRAQLQFIESEKAKAAKNFGSLFAMPYDQQADAIRAKIREITQGVSVANSEQKQVTISVQQTTKATEQQIQSQQRYTEEIRKQAQAIRESAEYKAGKNVLVTTPSGHDAVVNIKDRISIEDKLTEAYQKHIGQKSELDRIEQTDNNVAKERLGTEVAITNEISKRKKYSAPETQVGYDVTRDRLAQIIATRNNIQKNQVVNWDEQTSSIKTLSAALKQYQDAYSKMSAIERNSPFGKQMVADMQVLEMNIQSIRREMSRPIDFEFAKNLPANTLEEISYKTQMLRAYAQGINTETVSGQQELTKVMNIVESLGEKAKNLQKTTKQIQQDANSTKFDKISQMPTDSIKQVGQKIKEVRQYVSELKSQPIVDEKNLRRAEALFDRLIKQAQKLNSVQGTDKNVNSALKQQANTLDEISQKMQRLQAIRSHLNIETQKSQIDRINAALAELKKQQDGVLQRNQQMIASNTALGRSWNYMKNRLAFYFTISAGTSLIKNLVEVRSQYEMNERALGILINSAERGTQIFNELSQMALVSPYTLIELSSAAKQLTAYDVAAKDVVDTTRRLADMAAAVGIPIERLTYALGQIKAYGYLNSRDARMFANAGIPLVKQLSDYYTELEGKLVSTADVYDRIKKKAIDYNEVMEVINKMTDEGGKFFDFQAKMADTLKVRLANLTLAWNNMLNDMGKESQGVLTWGIGALREMFLHWKQLDSLIKNAAWALGIRTALMFIAWGALKAGNAFGIMSKQMALSAVFGTKLANVLKNVGYSVIALAKNRLTWISLFAVAAVEAAQAIWGVNEAQKALNESIRNGAKDNYDNISKFLEQYKEVRDSLYSTKKVAIGNIYNPTTRKAEATTYVEQQVVQDIDENEAKKAWEAVREQIELTVASSDKYIGNLLSISNMSERVRQGFNLLDDVQVVNAALKELDDDTIKVSKDLSAWWNAWQAPDGLIGNLKDYQETLDDIIAKYGTLESFRENTFLGGKGSDDINDYETALERFRDDLQKTTDSIINFIELKGWSGDESKINQVFEQIMQKLVLDNQLDPQKAFTLQTEVEEARSKAAKQSLLQRINDEKAAYKISHDENVRQAVNADIERYNSWNKTNGRSKVEWERFTKWLKEQHIFETTTMFRNMEAKDIASLNFMEGKHADWVKKMVTQYAKEHKMSYDEAFDYLKSWVQSANTWSVTIPVMLNVQEQSDFQKEFSKRVREKYGETALERFAKVSPNQNEDLATYTDNAWKNLKKLHEDEKKYNRDETEWGKKKKQETTDEIKLQEQALDLFNQKHEKETKGNKKDKVLEALKMEIDLVKKLQSDYDKLTKAGANSAEALMVVHNAYGKTINLINAKMGAIGLPKLDMSIITGKDPNKVLAFFDKVKDTLSMKGLSNVERMKAVEGVIQEFTVSAKTYNLDMITKGLNNELGKLKDEYELAVAIDADPELGNAFADMIGINVESLPHTVKEYADEYSKYLNKFLKGKNSSLQFTGDELRGLTRDDINALQSQVDAGTFNQEWFDAIKKAYEDISGKRKKDLEETEKWKNSLIEKYGNLQDKLTKIYKDSVQNQVNAVKTFSEDEDQKSEIVRLQLRLEETDNPAELAEINTEIAKIVKDVTDKNPIALKLITASDNQTKADTSKAYWEDFKNSELYTMTFEDMANNSTRAIQLIIDKLNNLKNDVKEDPASMKALIKSLEDAEKELNARDPFGGIARSLRDMSAASQEAKTAQEALWRAEVDVEQAQQEVDNAEDGTPEEQAAAQQKLADAVQRRTTAQVNLTKAENKGKKAQENLKSSLQGITGELGNVKSLFDTVSSLFRAGGDNETADAIDAISEGFSTMTTVIMGVVAAMALIKMSHPELLAIAAALSVIVGLVSFLSGNDNKKIDAEIKDSELAVKRLENAYKELQAAVEEAYGTMKYGAEQAAIANKKMQLEEKKRQLQLEKSRGSKDYDEDKIESLKGEIIDLEQEIKKATKDIINDMLGITSVGDAAEQMVSSMIDAFRSGEDYMAEYSNSFEDMIDNMIMKSIVSNVIGKKLEEMWNSIEANAEKRGATSKAEIERQQKAVSDYDSAIEYYEHLLDINDNNPLADVHMSREEIVAMIEKYKKEREKALANMSAAEQSYSDAIAPTPTDVEGIRNTVDGMKSGVEEEFKAWMEAFGISFGDRGDKNLSNLQQGIQGITEDTAGALEGITNGISQQVYLHSDLLTQIRDAVVGIDIDVQVATQAQMLLQLQQSYAVQMAIQGILEGTLNPSGQGFRVELIN